MKLKRGTVGFEEFQRYMEVLGVQCDLTLSYSQDDNTAMSTNARTREKIAVLEAQVEADRKHTEFQKTLVRDMRTALYSSDGYTDMALKHADDGGKVREYLQKVKSSNAQISILLDDMLGIKLPNNKPQTKDNLSDAQRLKGCRVLVVDDNEMNREISKDLLEDNGLIVEEAENGQQALDMIRAANPRYYDCVLMDIMMPVMDGLEATKQIRALPERVRAMIPIIAMTANAFEEDRTKSIEAGMDAHLTKPIDATALMLAMNQYIR